tara:strand:- start:194 stop:1045 length:852 start_codon:yes stop_codon:yes gene_type:complete
MGRENKNESQKKKRNINMKTLKLELIEHDKKIGKRCDFVPPTVTESCVLEYNEKIIGFYLTDLPDKLKQYITIANKEFLSKNVPKSLLERSDVYQMQKKYGISRAEAKARNTVQMSTILGGVLAKAHLRRPYNSVSAVHTNTKAKTFIKAMLLACQESEKLIEKYMPEQYASQKKLIEETTLPKYRFGKLFTSSISNYNIAAPFHQDRGNLKNTVNVILTKRKDTEGGALCVPDFNHTFEQADNSILVYPAWYNIHGVTKIIQHNENAYRNSLIFYPLKGFDK